MVGCHIQLIILAASEESILSVLGGSQVLSSISEQVSLEYTINALLRQSLLLGNLQLAKTLVLSLFPCCI